MRRVLASLLALACLTACAAGSTDADRGLTAGVGGSGSAKDPQQVFDMAADLDESLTERMQTCMDRRGYPQLLEAADLTVEHDPAGRRTPLAADLLEAGPYIAEQARRYGVLGTGALFQDDQPGHVISADAGYDGALLACREEFDRSHGIDSLSLLSALDRLRNDMRTRFLEELDGRVQGLLAARSECIRASGYPSLVLDPGVSIADTLESVGIPRGDDPGPPSPAVPDVVPGSILVLPPEAPSIYRPTQAEVDFALALVRCGAEQEFADRWTEAQEEPRRVVTAEFSDQLATLGQALAATTAPVEGHVRTEAFHD